MTTWALVFLTRRFATMANKKMNLKKKKGRGCASWDFTDAYLLASTH